MAFFKKTQKNKVPRYDDPAECWYRVTTLGSVTVYTKGNCFIKHYYHLLRHKTDNSMKKVSIISTNLTEAKAHHIYADYVMSWYYDDPSKSDNDIIITAKNVIAKLNAFKLPTNNNNNNTTTTNDDDYDYSIVETKLFTIKQNNIKDDNSNGNDTNKNEE